MALSGSASQPAAAPRDPGLQAERTAMAWNRTGLALFVNALLALRLGLSGAQSPLMLALGGVLLFGAGAVMWLGSVRRRALVGGMHIVAPPLGMVQFIALAAVAAGLTGLAGVLVSVLR